MPEQIDRCQCRRCMVHDLVDEAGFSLAGVVKQLRLGTGRIDDLETHIREYETLEKGFARLRFTHGWHERENADCFDLELSSLQDLLDSILLESLGVKRSESCH